MNAEDLNVEFSATGNEFKKHVTIENAVVFLNCLSTISRESFKTALNDQYHKNKDVYNLEPKIKISNLGIASLYGTFNTVVPPMLGLMAPHINSLTWSYLKNSFDLIKVLTTIFFQDKGKIPSITINEEMDGSNVVVAQRDGSVVVNNKNIIINTKKLILPIGQLSALVDTGEAQQVEIKALVENENPITIVKKNCKYYDARDIYAEGNEPKTFFCKIYRLNVKERNGLINIFESPDKMDNTKSTKFTIANADIIDFIEALKFEYSLAVGTINFKNSLLGDKEIVSVIINQIENVGPQQI